MDCCKPVRRIILFALFATAAAVSPVQGQLLGGLLSQKSTDLKLVGQQIALLQVYSGWLHKGYDIAKQGLTHIGDSKEGEFTLHSNYFTSLTVVNPNLRRSSAATDVLQQVASMERYAQAAQGIKGLKGEEQSFVGQTAEGLFQAGLKVLDDLDDLLTRGKETLTDNERLERLSKIDRDARNHNQLAMNLFRQATELNQQHSNDQHEKEELLWLYK